jgi:hypothetical protein
MTYNTILKLQEENGLAETQRLINNGEIWKFEGSMGTMAMSLLVSGACMLPKRVTFDYYGNRLPSRDELKKGTNGTFQNSVRYWENFDGFEEY